MWILAVTAVAVLVVLAVAFRRPRPRDPGYAMSDEAVEDYLRQHRMAKAMTPEAVEAQQKRLAEQYNRAVNAAPRRYRQEDLAPRREDDWSTNVTRPLNPLNPIGLTSSWGSDSSSSCGSDYSGSDYSGGGDSGSCGGWN